MSHSARSVENRPLSTCEIRKEDLDRLRREWFLQSTQAPSEVVARRIREYRQLRGLTLASLAGKMTDLGFPMHFSTVSRIESGEIGAGGIDQLLAFADALDVSLANLIGPREGEAPIRAGSMILGHADVAHWLAWGLSSRGWNETKLRDLVNDLATETQALTEARGSVRSDQVKAIGALLERLRALAGIRGGVLKRRALRATESVGPDRAG